ncbi:hypothetical protein FUAX_50100 (plasmid) [Fulvitalea axinellae]|uniref:Uncharacterized protein n=1 Tax=Fulvitalea axinellae TaxID=1182444 RepID=A0AAU9D9E9_9BACT|nr:hypothetical protein FUAX_44870 [Fulvitalea axinellae]BDD12578.1 hypothetical protein FUAX_50100 [Fulvitalea axinellae]
MNRLTIYPKDIQRLTGKSLSGARKEYRRLKQQLGKTAGQYLTLSEYCAQTGICPKEAAEHLS